MASNRLWIALPKVLDDHGHERQRQQRHHRQAGIERGHQHDRHDEHQDRVRRVHDRWSDHHPDRVQIVGRTRHQIAGATGLVVPDRHQLQPCEERVADIEFDVTRRADQNLPHQVAEHSANAGDAQERRRVEGKLRTGDPGVQIIDRVLQDPWRQQLYGRGDDDAQQPDDELAAVDEQERKEAAERGTHLSEYRGREASASSCQLPAVRESVS